MWPLYVTIAILVLVVGLIWRVESKARSTEREQASRKIAETILKNVERANEAETDSMDMKTDEKRKRLIDRSSD